jgi:septum formation protein
VAEPSRIVLASSSPRRRHLLGQLGVRFEVIAPDIDERERPGEAADAYVRRLAVEKAIAVRAPGDVLVIGADTTVELDGHILGKPADSAEAVAMLRRLSARTHRVHTGVAVRLGDQVVDDISTSLVTMVRLTPAMIGWYVATGEPFDKAGGYALQGAAAAFVQQVRGSVSGIVGLPLAATVNLARQLGVSLVG